MLLAFGVGLASAGSPHAAAPKVTVQYTITNLGDLGDTDPTKAQSQAYAINIHNQVVGSATTANGNVHAFLYSGGQMIDLGTLTTAAGSGAESWAYGINDQGVVVGGSDNSLGGQDAFYVQTSVAGAQMVYISFGSDPSAQDWGWAEAINNSNEIVGTVLSSALSIRGNPMGWSAFTYSVGGNTSYVPWYNYPITNIDTIPGYYATTAANAINSAGLIVGQGNLFGLYGGSEFDYSDGFLFRPNIAPQTAQLPGAGAQANGINSSGVIVGSDGGAVQWAVVSSKKVAGYQITSLGALHSSGDTNGTALGINSAGQIVGSSDVANATPHAFIYQNGKMTDLNSLIVPGQNGGFVTLSVATAINEAGAIVGYGQRIAGGPYFAFLAIPTVPTPVP
jgi:probable HAF family extracellular repeat protein